MEKVTILYVAPFLKLVPERLPLAQALDGLFGYSHLPSGPTVAPATMPVANKAGEFSVWPNPVRLKS